MYYIYWLINEQGSKTYVGFSNNIEQRIIQHRNKQVKTTTNFGHFQIKILEEVENVIQARQREKYWKSAVGRKKLKSLYKDI